MRWTRYYKYDRGILTTAESIVSVIKGTSDTGQSDLAEDADWLRWRISECWDPPEHESTRHYDDLVRMLAAEAVDLYDVYARRHRV